MAIAAGAAVAGTMGVAASGSAWAEDDDDGVFSLGEIHVTAPTGDTQESDSFGGSVLSGRQMEKFSTDTLDRALNLVPGVSSSNSGGSRNEQLVYVRGFDRWQVPLSIDGVRIYLPYDNRLDFGRFLTPDIAAVQVAKGYVSVLDGPGGMGGAINLVSYRPTKEFEAEGRTQAEFGTDGTYEGTLNYLRGGSRMDKGYVQASGTYRDLRGWMLPEGFTPTVVENGGLRDHSDVTDWNVNLKAAYTPNATDEYSLNFIKQSGSKGAPYHVQDPIESQRYWSWPWWDVQNLYWLSDTKIGEASYLKTKAYYNTFQNALDIYNNPAQSDKSSRSYYEDWAAGASAEFGTDFGTIDSLKAAFIFRRDNHTEWQDLLGVSNGCTVNEVCMTEPKQTTVEDTYSLALENTIHVTPRVDFVQGISYDWRHLSEAEDFTTRDGFNGIINYPLSDSDAVNYQGALIWRYSDTARLFANISDRTRFPTLFERFSSRFGGATSNPNLQPERAVNYQVGWSNAFAAKSQVSITGFYSDVTDMIQSVPIVYINPITHKATSLNQSQNVGDGYFFGAEGSIDLAINSEWAVGGNVSWVHREVTNPNDTTFQPSGVPEVKGMLFATWQPTENFKLIPAFEFADDRWTSYVKNKVTYYYVTGAYAIFNMRAEYTINKNFMVAAGVRNLFDEEYYLSDGYPEAGRSFYASLKATF
ncbi:TonB-dependent receptor [Blastochloris sulfoviridis]|nr:TonB-dependent receptor [Blastochloris sulfoviridis]